MPTKYASAKRSSTHFSAGWNPAPRVERPMPWTTYPAGLAYAGAPSSEDLALMARSLVKWVDDNPDYATTGHVLAFAWNEFEEGSYICPTLGAQFAYLINNTAMKDNTDLTSNVTASILDNYG